MESYDLKVLIIDDDFVQLTLLDTLLKAIKRPKCQWISLTDPKEVIHRLKEESFDLVISDYMLGEINGRDILKIVKGMNPTIPVVLITSKKDISLAISMMKEGAYDFILKPIDRNTLEAMLLHVLDRCQLEHEIERLKKSMNDKFSLESIIGVSPGILNVIDIIGRCSDYLVNVLVRGESGTGKELVAHALHHSSTCSEGPFVILNIAALSESLIESELFGHVKGAFTGADHDRVGRFEEAHGGTLFIDEIGDVSPAIQVKLLRAIQFKEFQRIGDNQTRTSHVRIIAATSRNLEKMMEDGDFRADLYYRLNVVEVQIPPLRDRKEDIPLLINHFKEKFRKEQALDHKDFSREAMDLLMSYHYPGNVRELQNIIEHATVFSRDDQIRSEDLPTQLAKNNKNLVPLWDGKGYQNAMDRFEGRLLQKAIDDAMGNQSEAARLLDISERRLRYRLEKLGIPSATNKPKE